MSYTTNLEIQDEIIGKMGLGVDYYKGEPGEQGIPGKDGKTPVKGVDYFTDAEITEIKDEIAEKVQVGAKGEDGKNAYQLAVEAGYEGSETEWLASLKGKDGKDGTNGINGTNGKDGKDGTNGVDGKTPVKGVDYFTTAEIQQIENEAAAKVDLSDYAKTADLSTVATSGSYEDLTNKPNIPDAYELPVASATTLGGVKVGSGLDITNGVLSATGGGIADVVDWSKVQNKPNFANVATSGDYNDLSNKPAIPSVEGLASESYVNEKVAAIVIPEVPTKVSELENDKGYLTEHQSLEGYAKTADLAQVAKTGSYNDLVNKPTIPSTAGLASTKYVDDKVAGIVIPTVPTKVSAFENDKGYLTEHQSLAEYAKKTEIPAPYTLPTASTSTLGGVKVDGNTITITDGVISAKGGSGGAEPDAYIKDASVSGNTLTLTKKDNTNVVFTPSGSGGGSGAPSYALKLEDTYTAEDISHIEAVKADRNIQMTIDNFPVIGFYDVDIGNNTIIYYVMTDDTDPLLYREYQYKQGLKIQIANYKSKSIKHLQWSGVTKNSDLPKWIMDWVENPYQYLVTVDDGGIVIRVDKAMFQDPPFLAFDYISIINGEPTLTKYCSIYFTNMDMNAYNSKNPQKGTKDTILTASNYSNYIK